MVKALGENGEIILGLSSKNLELLRQGKPILVDDAKIGPKIIILWGETEDKIVEKLREHYPNISGEDH